MGLLPVLLQVNGLKNRARVARMNNEATSITGRKNCLVFSRNIVIWLTAAILLISCRNSHDYNEIKAKKISVIYSTDLFHPYGDMDDQIDLAVLFALKDVEIKALILDNSTTQTERPGRIPVEQIITLAGKRVPYATGLSNRLASFNDTGKQQPVKDQQAVELILKVLSDAPGKVTLVSVGSLRDFAAAFNRNKSLFHEKLEKIFVFAGEANLTGSTETNVRLDPKAFVQIMNSGLPIVWVPCFDGGIWQNHGKASYWQTDYKTLLSRSSEKILNYLIYAYRKMDSDPVAYLSGSVDQNLKRKLFKKARNLWSCSVFPAIQNQLVELVNSSYRIMPAEKVAEEDALFYFSRIKVRFTSSGEARYGEHPDAHELLQFRVNNKERYKETMTEVAADLLSEIR